MKITALIIALFMSGILSAQNAPYNVNRKKFPLGQEFRKLLPEEIGGWERFAFHDYIPGQEQGTVYYQKAGKQIVVIFGKASSQDNMKGIWKKLYDDATDGKETQVKQKNITSTTTKYFLMEGKEFLYAWTRNLYYFSISTKDKSDADEFMKSFPW